MKKFLLISGGLLVIALLIVVSVFLYLSFQIKVEQPALGNSSTTVSITEAGQVEADNETIPLRDLPISDSQQKVLETVGVDVDTFVITPAMQNCAVEKLGAKRMVELIAGAAPTALETAKLLPCIGKQ